MQEVSTAPALGLRSRVVLEASANADVLLRTGAATLLAGVAAPSVLLGDAGAQRERLRFYADLGRAGDPARAFPAPPAGIDVEAVPSTPRAFHPRAAEVCDLRFESPFEALHPPSRAGYAALRRNRTAWAQHWRHGDEPRPTLCVVHGFSASPYWFNSWFFALPWFFRLGYDVLLYTMPLHGARRSPLIPMNGLELFTDGTGRLHEALFQAVHDLRVFFDHLEGEGVPAMAVTGLSLGGYVTGLMAAVEPRVHAAIPNAPVTDIARVMRLWFPAGALYAVARHLRGIDGDDFDAALAAHSPLSYPPVVDRDRLMIIGGLGDRLAPPEQSELLWEHWGRPRLHWYPGNHTVHIERGAYLKEMRRFLRETEF
jgi:hypothetical protein